MRTFDQPPREHQYVFRANDSRISAVMLCGCCWLARRSEPADALVARAVRAWAISGEEPIVHSEGEEGGLVTRGTVELTVDGQISVLNAGDGYYFPTTLPHRFRNIGADEVEIISANTPANF